MEKEAYRMPSSAAGTSQRPSAALTGLTSTLPLPSSTILSCAATSGLACSRVTSNLSWKILASEKEVGKASEQTLEPLSRVPAEEETWRNLTDFTNAECFPQARGLVLHRPLLEQLFEHGRLCAIVDGLHVGAAGISLHLDEILQSPHPAHTQKHVSQCTYCLLIWCFTI